MLDEARSGFRGFPPFGGIRENRAPSHDHFGYTTLGYTSGLARVNFLRLATAALVLLCAQIISAAERTVVFDVPAAANLFKRTDPDEVFSPMDPVMVPQARLYENQAIEISASGCIFFIDCIGPDGDGGRFPFPPWPWCECYLPSFSLIGRWGTSSDALERSTVASDPFFVGSHSVLRTPSTPGEYYLFLGWHCLINESHEGAYTVTASWSDCGRDSELRICSASPPRVGNAGQVTIEVRGCSLDPEARVLLTRDAFPEEAAFSAVGNSEYTRLLASFDLSGRPLGRRDLVVENPDGQIARLPGGIVVAEAVGERLWVEVVATSIRVGRRSPVLIHYGNSGDTDARYPWLAVGLPWQLPYDVALPWALPQAEVSRNEPEDEDALELTLIDLPPLRASVSETLVIHVSATSQEAVPIIGLITSDPSAFFRSVLDLSGEASLNSPVGVGRQAPPPPEDIQSFPQVWPRSDSNPPPGYVLFWDWSTAPDGHPFRGGWHMAVSIGGGEYIEMFRRPDEPLNAVPLRKLRIDPQSLSSDPYFRGAWRPSQDYDETYGSQVVEKARRLLEIYGQQARSIYDSRLCESDFVETPRGNTLWTNCLGLVHLLHPDFQRLQLFPLRPGLIAQDEIYDALTQGALDERGQPLAWDSHQRLVATKHRGRLVPSGKCQEALRELMAGVRRELNTVVPQDPNCKAGPSGADFHGTPFEMLRRWVGADNPLGYAVFFENLATATAAAQEVLITDQIDPNLDLSTFRFDTVHLGLHAVQVSPNGGTYVVDLRPLVVALVEITCQFDSATGVAEWLFRGRDPLTGELADFLPPNKAEVAPIGEGWVTFDIMPRTGIVTGTVIRNHAIIDFEISVLPDPLDTNEHFNTIDATPPTSWVRPLPVLSESPTFEVEWNGSDTEAGSGLKDVTVWVSENKSPPFLWIENTTSTSGIWTGRPGGSYAFFTVARDFAGNRERVPLTADAADILPDATTTVLGNRQLPGDCNQDTRLDISDAVCLFGFLFLGTPQQLPCGDRTAADPANETLLNHNSDARIDISDGIGILSFLFSTGPPPAAGRDCLPISGCPAQCGDR